MQRLELPILLLVLVLYYLHSMVGYVAPLSIPDEFGYIAPAAFLNGHDWVAVARGVPWYSYGYSLLLAPVFALTATTQWYHDAQLVNVALIVALGICANLFLRKVDRRSTPRLRHLVVAIVLLYPSVLFYAHLAWAETLIAVMPWLLGWLLYRVFEARRRYLEAFLCGCLLMAAYYIHARLIVMLLAAVLVLVFVAIKAARWRELLAILLGMIVVVAPALWFKDYLLAHLYGGAVHGTQGSIVEMLETVWDRLGRAGAWRDFVGSAAGQFVYLVIATAGLLIVGLVQCVRRMAHGYAQNDWAVCAGMGFVVLSAAGCYVLILLTMGIAPRLPHHIFYGRYTEPLVLPMAAVGLLYLCRKPKQAYRWMFCALVIACILVPVGVSVAKSLPDQTTYWTLITGLFTYRTADWHLATGTLLIGFLVVTVAVSVAFRIQRYVGLALVGAMFLTAGIGLVQTYASAPYSKVQRWQAWSDPAFKASHPRVMLDMEHGDPLFLRTNAQVINAGLQVVPKDQWHAGQTSAYERIAWDGKSATHSLCNHPKGENGPVRCVAIAQSPYHARVELRFDQRAVAEHRAHLATSMFRVISELPYLRAVWNDLYSSHIHLQYTIASAVPTGVLIKVFVTVAGNGTWLVDRPSYIYTDGGTINGNLRVPVPVRAYGGRKLPRGHYVLHAVVVGSGGNEWKTQASIPMQID